MGATGIGISLEIKDDYEVVMLSISEPAFSMLTRLSPPRGASWEPVSTLRSAKKSHLVGAVAHGREYTKSIARKRLNLDCGETADFDSTTSQRADHLSDYLIVEVQRRGYCHLVLCRGYCRSVRRNRV